MEIKKNKKKKIGGPQNINIDELKGYKKLEKTYRAYMNVKTDYSQVLDDTNLKNESEILDLKGFKVYKLKTISGVYIIKNFLSLEEQLEIAKSMLNEYIQSPYRTNLDNTVNIDESKIHVKDKNKYCFNNKIRWSNLGFQYDWTNRRYPDEKTSLPKN